MLVSIPRSIHMMLARMGIAYRIVGHEEVQYRSRL